MKSSMKKHAHPLLDEAFVERAARTIVRCMELATSEQFWRARAEQITPEMIRASLPDSPLGSVAGQRDLPDPAAHLRMALAQLHETHRRAKKSEATLQKTVGRLTARVAQLEARGLTRSRWKADAPLQPMSYVYVQIDQHVRELRIKSINWRRDDDPQWTLCCYEESPKEFPMASSAFDSASDLS